MNTLKRFMEMIGTVAIIVGVGFGIAACENPNGSGSNRFDSNPVRYTVTFDSNGGTPVEELTGIVPNATIRTEPTSTKPYIMNPTEKISGLYRDDDKKDLGTPDNYDLAGWVTEDGVKWNFNTMPVTKDMTLTARWVLDEEYELWGVDPQPVNLLDYGKEGDSLLQKAVDFYNKNNAQPVTLYLYEDIYSAETQPIAPKGSYENRSFTIVGVGGERKINFVPTKNDASLFTLGVRGNLKFMENVTLVGYPFDVGVKTSVPFEGFVIRTNGIGTQTIEMEGNSKITGHRSIIGVIQLRGAAKLEMKGNAEISGNTYVPPSYPYAGTRWDVVEYGPNLLPAESAARDYNTVVVIRTIYHNLYIDMIPRVVMSGNSKITGNNRKATSGDHGMIEGANVPMYVSMHSNGEVKLNGNAVIDAVMLYADRYESSIDPGVSPGDGPGNANAGNNLNGRIFLAPTWNGSINQLALRATENVWHGISDDQEQAQKDKLQSWWSAVPTPGASDPELDRRMVILPETGSILNQGKLSQIKALRFIYDRESWLANGYSLILEEDGAYARLKQN